MILQVNHLGKTYHGGGKPVRALQDVSLQVAEGEMVVVCGRSGSGKSTLLLCCGGLLAPEEGEISVGGQNPYLLGRALRAAFRARTVGFVFQQFHLIPYLSVFDNVLAAGADEKDKRLRERAVQLLDRFGMRERIRHLPGELSVGERQRAALARAMLNDPPLILADEPTGNLDPDNSQGVLAALRECAESGKGVLLVTHDPEAADFAHRILLLEHGQLGMGAASRPSVGESLLGLGEETEGARSHPSDWGGADRRA